MFHGLCESFDPMHPAECISCRLLLLRGKVRQRARRTGGFLGRSPSAATVCPDRKRKSVSELAAASVNRGDVSGDNSGKFSRTAPLLPLASQTEATAEKHKIRDQQLVAILKMFLN